MYVSFFGLKQAPFSIAPDPRYLFMSERHREALAHLLYGLGSGGGFVLLTGEVGAGKTTVCRCFLEQVPADCQVAYIFNPKLTVTELLQTVADEFGIAGPAGGPAQATVKDYIDPLNAHLLTSHAEGRHCVLVIDEAQNLSADVLEQLRLLTNLETHERKLLQIILIGQPELRTLLAEPGLAQLAQRVIARYHLGALGEGETAHYVAHRMAVAGLTGPLPFDRAALRRMHQFAGGVPRRINLLADRALLGAYAEGRPQVGARTVARAAAEVFDAAPAGPGLDRRGAMALALGGLVLAGGLLVAARGGFDHGGAAGLSRAAGGTSAAASAAASAVGAGPAVAASASPVAASTASVAPAATSAAALVAAVAGVNPAPSAATGPLAAASAAVAAAAPAAAPVPLDLAAFNPDEREALAELLPLWQLPASGAGSGPASGAASGAADPCAAAQAAQVPCHRAGNVSVALLRALDRPGLLALRDGQGRVVHARLAGLGAREVVLASGQRAWRLPLEDLAGLWRGEFVTLWRAPAGYTAAVSLGARGPAVDALASGLARLRREAVPPAGQPFDEGLARRTAGFQLAWGLKPDGVAGPTTFMQLNRALGVAEPTLNPER